ncbi:MAG: carbohydrate binding domain-containing protein [Gammaproteobacteria bacterium]|nr:carbohydrate binding domain-containing protein [Gammaproteobacteria bacterium]
MHAESYLRRSRILAAIIPAIALAGCFGEGSGPESIANAPVTPLPPIPPGFCDPINFEILCPAPTVVNFNGGATTTIDNPDKSGINTSDSVAQMQKFADEVFGGTRFDLAAPIDFANGEAYKVKVWSSRAVPVAFKLEETGNPGGGRTIEISHSGSGMWEELCYDFTGQTASIPNPPVLAVTIIFDLGVLGMASSDPDNWTFFYDDIEQVESCVDEPDPFDAGLLTNGSFEDGTSPWLSGVSSPIDAANIVDDGGANVYFVNVTAAGNAFDVNLSQKLTIIPDEVYTLTFRARSDRNRTILAGIGLSDGDFSNTSQTVNLTPDYQTFTLVLTAAGFGDANSRVLFDMGAEVGEVYLDEVKLILGEPFDDGLLTNGDFEAGTSPWLAGVSSSIGSDNVIDDGGNNVYFVNVTAAGNAFDVNLSQKLTIVPDETYTLSFMARSDRDRTMLAGIGLSDGDFANTSQSVNLSADWLPLSLELTAAGFGDDNSRVLFDMGAEVGEIYIDDVSLVVTGGGT